MLTKTYFVFDELWILKLWKILTKKLILCGNRELWRVYAYKKKPPTKRTDFWLWIVNLCGAYTRKSLIKKPKNFGLEVKWTYSEVMSLCLFFSPGKSFFSSKTEINDENVDRQKFETYSAMNFEGWEMEFDKGLKEEKLNEIRVLVDKEKNAKYTTPPTPPPPLPGGGTLRG